MLRPQHGNSPWTIWTPKALSMLKCWKIQIQYHTIKTCSCFVSWILKLKCVISALAAPNKITKITIKGMFVKTNVEWFINIQPTWWLTLLCSVIPPRPKLMPLVEPMLFVSATETNRLQFCFGAADITHFTFNKINPP